MRDVILRGLCCRCQTVQRIFGTTAAGDVCAACAPYAACHDCGKVTRKSDLLDLGDGFHVCAACIEATEVMRMAALAQQEAR